MLVSSLSFSLCECMPEFIDAWLIFNTVYFGHRASMRLNMSTSQKSSRPICEQPEQLAE